MVIKYTIPQAVHATILKLRGQLGLMYHKYNFKSFTIPEGVRYHNTFGVKLEGYLGHELYNTSSSTTTKSVEYHKLYNT